MAVSNVWKPDKIVLASTVSFTQFESKRIAPQIERALLRSAGHPAPTAVATRRQRPILEFSTPQIDKVASAIPVTGLALTDDSYLYFKHAAAVGVTAADARTSTTHRRIKISQLVAYWTTIQATHGGQATANVVICAVYDGTNDPLVPAGTVALDGDIADGNEVEFGCGPASLVIAGPTTIDCRPLQININSGVQLLEEGTGSELWDTFVGVNMVEPNIEIQTLERHSVENFGMSGIALASTGLTAFLRKTGPRAADATAAHVKIAVPTGVASPGDSQSSDGRWTDTIRIDCTSAAPTSGTYPQPITLTAAQAIA